MGYHAFGIQKSKFFMWWCKQHKGVNNSGSFGVHTKPGSRSTGSITV